jgi:Chaperone of endosialidase
VAIGGALTSTTLTSPAATALTIQSAGTTAMTVDTSQNVGIGTTSPTSKLQISNASAVDTTLQVSNTLSTTKINTYSDGSSSLETTGAYAQRFFVSGSERMRIDTGGNLLVGTTSQLNNSYGSRINVQASANNGIIVAGSAANWSALVFLNGSNALIGYLNATQSNISLVNVSDYRLKKNVTPMITGLNAVKALKPVTYDWTNSDESGEGFIAHELQAVLPHAVTGEKDAVNEDGSIKPQGVDYSKIVVHLVAAMQELSAKNDALEARLAALEAK